MYKAKASSGACSIVYQLHFVGLILAVFVSASAFGQTAATATARETAVERGSLTAKGGFRNETEIRDKFTNWKTDADAREWLARMGYDPAVVESVSAMKPLGEKADVVVRIRLRSTKNSTESGKTTHGSGMRTDMNSSRSTQATSIGSSTPPRLEEFVEGISIKLVSTANGFNQIDKRWLRQYALMWKMPADVTAALRLYLGEERPLAGSRNSARMFITEFDKQMQGRIVEFFTANKQRIISDLLKGNGPDRATRLMVAWKPGTEARWTIVPIDEAIRFYADGPVEITRSGNLKIGRVTMQRKGGDGGRETAKMLQFKMNPVQIFSTK